MENVPNDRRAIRTKRMIRTALSELIEEKGFNEISITDLTSRADINRGTFYLHYTDKYDLLEQVENEILTEIKEETKNIDSINLMGLNPVNEPLPFIIKLFEYFKDNKNLMCAILGPKGDPNFQSKLKKLMKTNLFEGKLIKTFNNGTILVPEEYFIAYIVSAHLGMLHQWLLSGMKESPEMMALILTRMFFLGPFKAAGL